MIKGDSLLLLDDANSYWWLVRVLKSEDVGYIPAENIETPYERLARLNKHRNVDLAAATNLEQQTSEVNGRIKPKQGSIGQGKNARMDAVESRNGRKVGFAPPTYVEHPGNVWSDEEGEESGDGVDMEDVERASLDGHGEDEADGAEPELHGVDSSLAARGVYAMEPDDGVEWADNALASRQSPGKTAAAELHGSPAASTSPIIRDPLQAGGETRRITATPAVAENQGPLLPSAIMQNSSRNVSGQSTGSTASSTATGVSSNSSSTVTSPPDGAKARKRKDEKDPANGEKKKKGILTGLFSRNKKERSKGISSSDPRSSEESMVSGSIDESPASTGRMSEESPNQATSSRSAVTSNGPPQVSVHGLRLQQRDQALQQSYSNKYLRNSQSTDATSGIASNGISRSAEAMRRVTGPDGSRRPASIILSPSTAGPPLLNVMRIFAGDHIRSDAAFKTVLINETTSSSDLIRQAVQRYHLSSSSHTNLDSVYFLTVKDVNGEEMELDPSERPLEAFHDAIKRWADEQQEGRLLGDMTPTVKRSSIGSITSVMSLSTHPSIAKLGMNDYSDDSAVKLYIHRRRPGSTLLGSGLPEPKSEFSSYSSQLSTIQDSEASVGSSFDRPLTPPAQSLLHGNGPSTPQAQPRYNAHLTVNTQLSASPERFSSPSARFTVQIAIQADDLPDGVVLDPAADGVVLRSSTREPSRAAGRDSLKRLFMLPRNVTVAEAIEQGLARLGIQDGVVEGGDHVENRHGQRAMYALAAATTGQGESRMSDRA